MQNRMGSRERMCRRRTSMGITPQERRLSRPQPAQGRIFLTGRHGLCPVTGRFCWQPMKGQTSKRPDARWSAWASMTFRGCLKNGMRAWIEAGLEQAHVRKPLYESFPASCPRSPSYSTCEAVASGARGTSMARAHSGRRLAKTKLPTQTGREACLLQA